MLYFLGVADRDAGVDDEVLPSPVAAIAGSEIAQFGGKAFFLCHEAFPGGIATADYQNNQNSVRKKRNNLLTSTSPIGRRPP